MLGVLFDLDGTLIDSTEVHLLAFLDALDVLGIPRKEGIEKEFYSCAGMRFPEIVKAIYPNIDEKTLDNICAVKRQTFSQYIGRIRLLPNVRECLDALHGRYPLALVTSASKRFVNLIFGQVFPDLSKYFDAVVTAEDVEKGKPDPEPYLLGAERLGVDDAVVVGDTKYDRLSAEGASFRFVHARDIGRLPEILERIRE